MASGKVLAKAEGPAASSGGGVLKWLLPLVLATLIAAGAGSFLGLQIVSLKPAARPADSAPKAAVEAGHSGDSVMTELHPIVTNLAAPEGSWIRLQASIVYDNGALPKPDIVAAEIADDLVAYLRTLSLAQIQGASGLQALREDLNERASIRADGHIRELVIETLVVR